MEQKIRPYGLHVDTGMSSVWTDSARYLILSDSFHADPRKSAFIDALLSKLHVVG